MSTYTVEGIVLRTHLLGESDKILTVFSKEKGKFRAVAKGSRRPKSSLVASSEVLTASCFQIATGRNLDIITQAQVITTFRHLRTDIVKMAWATYICELIELSVGESEPHEALYGKFMDYLEGLSQEVDLEIVSRAFELAILGLLGYEPELTGCIICGTADLSGSVGLSSRLGGIVCSQCARTEPNIVSLSKGAFETMRVLAVGDKKKIGVLRIPDSYRRQIGEATLAFLSYHLERVPKSLEFLKTITS